MPGGRRGSFLVNKRQHHEPPRTKPAAMPRFPEESVSCLKRTMLTRSPSFVFTTGDVESIMKETGLDKAQVQAWAELFRFRCKFKKFDDTLDFLRSKKVT